MNDIDADAGKAVHGGLPAGATGRAGTRDNGHFSENFCLNCGAALVGAYCHECGQQAHLHRTLGAFMHDLLHGALHFEGKTWRTLPQLALKPGELTRRYIEGERAAFVSPMGLFLFSVFLMFAVFQIAGIGLSTPNDFGSAGTDITQAIDNLGTERAELRAELAVMAGDDADRAQTTAALANVEEQLTALNSLPVTAGSDWGNQRIDTGWKWLDKSLGKWRDNPNLMLYKLQSNSYKFSWLLIPLSIPFMWLLFFWKRRYRAYDHAIFITYSIAFMSLLFILVSILVKIGASEAIYGSILFLVPPIHMYRQLRGAYHLKRRSALWRLAALLVFITVITVLFLQIVLVLGVY